VLERRSSPDGFDLFASWLRVLAVVTADRWLHVYDLPASVGADATPAAAFRSIAPALDGDKSKAASSGGAAASLTAPMMTAVSLDPLSGMRSQFENSIWHHTRTAMIKPTMSLNLRNCAATQRPAPAKASLLVTETVRSAFFPASGKRKLALRCGTHEGMLGLVEMLRSAGEGGGVERRGVAM